MAKTILVHTIKDYLDAKDKRNKCISMLSDGKWQYFDTEGNEITRPPEPIYRKTKFYANAIQTALQ